MGKVANPAPAAKADNHDGGAAPRADRQGPAADRATTEEIADLSFGLLSSAFYHDMRAHWLGRANRFLLFLVLMLGSASVTSFVRDMPLLGQVSGLLVAAITSLLLVFDFAGRARDHGELKRRFYALLADLQEGGDVGRTKARATLIYADEPPLMHAVNAVAHNLAGTSLFGDEFSRVKIPLLRRCLMHVRAFHEAQFALA